MQNIILEPKKEIIEYGENHVILLMGYTGAGKSDTEHALIRHWRSTNPSDPIYIWDIQRQFGAEKYGNVIKLDPNNWSHFLSSEHPPGHPKAGHPVVCNSCILLDDFRTLFEKFHQPEGLKKFFIDKRFHNNTVIVSVHTVNDVLELMKGYISKYYFFHTKSREDLFMKRLEFPELCYNASLIVNAYYATWWQIIKHPNQKGYVGQRFPYAIVDTKTAPMGVIDFKEMERPFYMNGKLMNGEEPNEPRKSTNTTKKRD